MGQAKQKHGYTEKNKEHDSSKKHTVALKKQTTWVKQNKHTVTVKKQRT